MTASSSMAPRIVTSRDSPLRDTGRAQTETGNSGAACECARAVDEDGQRTATPTLCSLELELQGEGRNMHVRSEARLQLLAKLAIGNLHVLAGRPSLVHEAEEAVLGDIQQLRGMTFA